MENKIDILLKRFQIEHEKGDRGGIYAYTQRKLAYNSNKIEGSTLTERQTASIFDTGTISADGTILRTKDIEEMTGHFTMFNYMLQVFDKPLSEEIIKAFHYHLKAGVFEDMANGYPVGEYKNRKNIVSDIEASLPEQVSEDMDAIIRQYHEKSNHSIEDIAVFHAKFEKVHPFQDGNGRVGRIIVFKECLKNRITPVIIQDSRKAEYYEYLNRAQQKGEYEKLFDYFKDEQKIYDREIAQFIIPVTPKAAKKELTPKM